MANIKQQAKRNLTNEKKRLQNAAFKSSIKTAIKKFETAVQNNNLEEAKANFNDANKKLDKALAKGLFHKNKVSRMKSHISKLLNTIA
ncbi:MAG TPA: 30S ribosomal protein S20 [Acholeplasmataceae bacterium]|jgi:small subunit ribosomal protein S20|nr:30S ribosomal protein S20 [Acholeplasmataceae bacterium]